MVLRVGFEWDLVKDEINKEKYGVTFTEATEVFERVSLTAPDRRFPYGEERWITIGSNHSGTVLVIAHTRRGSKIRIISARRANKKERQTFYAKIKPFL